MTTQKVWWVMVLSGLAVLVLLVSAEEAAAQRRPTAGSVQTIKLTGPGELFTGDSGQFQVTAYDTQGNPVPDVIVTWSATLGQIDSSGLFTAGRKPGEAQVVTVIADGPGTVEAVQSVSVRAGYCDTIPAATPWQFDWYLDPPNTSLAEDAKPEAKHLGTEYAGKHFQINWGEGPLFAGHTDHVKLVARTSLVVQKQGPVMFLVKTPDRVELLLDGQMILTAGPNRPGEVVRLITLTPGIYDLEMHYHHGTGPAALTFKTDVDVEIYIRTKADQCYGTYVVPPAVRYFVHYGESVEEAARRFGIEEPSAVHQREVLAGVLGPLDRAMLVLGSGGQNIKVIFLDGMGSWGGYCHTKDGAWGRRHIVLRAAQRARNDAPGSASVIDEEDVLAYSYSGVYYPCNFWPIYPAEDPGKVGEGHPKQRKPKRMPMPWPAYQHIDTCPGVKDSAKHLESLVNQVLAKEPDAKIVLVGFSLGGLVASYYVSQQPMAFVWKHIGRVVTIDSPLRGDPRLGNGCTTDRNGTKVPVGRVWADIDKNSEVVRAITGMGYERTMRFTNINSTNIGDFLDGAERVLLGCGSFDDFDPWSMFGLIPKSHDCAFWSEEGLRAISKAVNTPIPDFSRFPDMRVGGMP